MSDHTDLTEFVTTHATELDVPGVAVGVLHEGTAHQAFHGVTSVDNPLPVDERTLFQFGSTGKTYTATAMLRLVDQGLVDLAEPVRRYLPDLRLREESVAEAVTILQLFNHTAGWSGDLMTDTGRGDDALASYVGLLADVDQVTPLGSAVSYNNAALSVAGRVIETVTGSTYEQAIRDLLLDPLGMDHTFFFAEEIMTHRFAVGHVKQPDGTISVARPWALPRGGAPAGGMSANAADLLTWARFHLGDGRTPEGERLLSEELLQRMQQPSAHMPGSALGDSVGISWLLSDVEGVRLVSHGGTTIGQHSTFVMVPEHGFALTVMTNCGPNGPELNTALERWALEHYLGVIMRDPQPVALALEALQPYVGTYETIATVSEVSVRDGGLSLATTIKPEVLAALGQDGDDAPEDEPPLALGLLDGDDGRYIITDGPAKGMKGYFQREADGTVTGVHAGGRYAPRTPSR